MAKANNLDLETVVVDTANPTPEYLKYNKLGKVPTFVGADGYVLSECMAIAIYGTFETSCVPPGSAHFILCRPSSRLLAPPCEMMM